NKIDNAVPAEEIAVLYRDNKDAFPIARALEKMGVIVSIESDEELFYDPLINKFLIFLKAINFFGQDEELSQALHIDWFKIDPALIFRLINQARSQKQNLLDVLSECPDKMIKNFYNNLIEHKILAQNESLLVFFEKAVRGSGLLENIISRPDSWEKFEMVNSLFNEVKSLINTHPEASLKDFFDYLETIKKHKILLRNKKTLIKAGQVRLMTVHRSKGLEFDFVYITGANDGHFGGRRKIERLPLLPRVFSLIDRSSDDFDFGLDATDDERRLFYVAITRARKEVIITAYRLSLEGRENLPSSYLSEIDSRLVEEKSIKDIEDDFNKNKHIFLFESKQQNKNTFNDRDLVIELFTRQGMSVTALNNYLECPWKYFYQNLIRLPSAPIKSASYGNAVHKSLRDFFSHLKEEDTGVDSLLASFEKYLNAEVLTTEDYQESLSRGQEALRGWYENYQNSWNNNVITEFRIKDVELGPQIRLTGILDKIEFIDLSNKVNVVDYKSRAPMSRNEIMGLTKSASGDIYRQLVFYKILLDRFENKKYEMVSGEIDFIQPDNRGNYKKEKFEITDKEKKELEELIKKVAAEIINLKFWDKRCQDDKCYFCSLRSMLN
ncbi:MAG TPA: ATP-dependent helicase, partial [Candidatus Vogelbacteria bacterium]|nr:ATP-dependent helicase [Candidatus Vogelbacteria bacterium]